MSIDRKSSQPLYQQVAQDIQRRIRAGALPPGARLPTVRELAMQLGVTRLTVHSAYSELQSGGWVEATVGRGTFVASRVEAPAAFEPAREVSAQGVISDMMRMAQLPGMRSMAMADAAPEFFPQREFNRAVDEALRAGATSLAYTFSQGEPLLRTMLAELLRERGLRLGPDELLVTSGVTQGLALIAQTLARPGDCVLVERPTYLGALNVFSAHGVRPIGAPLDDDGLVVDALEPLIVAHRPRFIYTIPTFQNPSGVCLSPARRSALLALAARHNLPIVEDDIYGMLAYEGRPAPALKADDQHDRVIYLSSFSKSLLPGIRMGYIGAAPTLIERLAVAKQANDLCSPPMLQRAVALFIQHGWMDSHMRRVLPRYRERRDALAAAMARYFPSGVRWTIPDGGFCSWVALPAGVAPTELYLAAIDRGAAFAPGDVFFAEANPPPYIRLAFSGQPPETIADVTRIIGELLNIQLARRSYQPRTVTEWVPLV